MATPNSQLAAELWPQILRRLERWQRNVGTGGGGSGTVTVEFTGTVTDAMAPQFVLRDGSRSLQGNLAVETGVTIDGVDLDVHAGDAAAHHAPVTAGDGIGVTGQSVAVNSSVVRTTRMVSTGDGLTGGGALDADRTLEIDLATDPGLELTGTSPNKTLRAKIVTTDMTRTSSGLGVNRAIAPTWTGVHTFNAIPVVNANLLFTGARSVTSDGSNALTLAPGGNLVLNPGGDSRLASAKEFRAQTFSDTPMATGGFRLFDQGSNVYRLTIGSLRADELHARVFVADEIRVDRGAEYWSKSFGIVETTTLFPAVYEIDTDVWFENAPGLGSANLFAANDWLMANVVDWGSGLTLARAWFKVTSKQSSTSTRQLWRIKWMTGTLPNDTLRAGTLLVNVGQSGQGWVHLSALTGDGGPFLQIGTWAGSDPYTPANVLNRVRMGHLSGVAGYGTGKWGFAAGNDLALTPTTGFSGITAEATDGARLHNTQIDLYDGGTLAVRINQSRGIIFGQEIDLEPVSRRMIRWYDNPAALTGPKGAISSFTWSSPEGGDTLYLAPVFNTTVAALTLTANRSSNWADGTGTTNGVQITGSRFRVNTRAVFKGNVIIQDSQNEVPSDASLLSVGALPDSGAQALFVATTAGRNALRLKAAASPTVPVFEVEDSSGNTSIAIGANQDIQARSVMALRATGGASLAADGVLDTGYGYALVYVYSSTLGRGALFRIDVDGSTLISGSSSHYTGTADTASRVNVYYSGGTIRVQNKNATSRNVRVWMMTT